MSTREKRCGQSRKGRRENKNQWVRRKEMRRRERMEELADCGDPMLCCIV